MRGVFFFLFISGFLNLVNELHAQDTACAPTVSDIFSFQKGDILIYSYEKEKYTGGPRVQYYYHTDTIEILDVQKNGDTLFLSRRHRIGDQNHYDTWHIIDSVNHPLNSCDTVFHPYNSFLYDSDFKYDRNMELDSPAYVRIHRDSNDLNLSVKRSVEERNNLYTLDSSGEHVEVDEGFLVDRFSQEFGSGVGLLSEGVGGFEWSSRHVLQKLIRNGDTVDYYWLTTETLIPKEPKVFPNPASQSFNIHLVGSSSVEIQIFGSDGRLVFTENLKNSYSTIDCSNWTTGLYFIQIRDERSSYRFSLIKN